MSNKKRKYTDEFKAEALQLLRSSGRPVSQLERELGITQGLLSKWRRIDEVEKAGTGYQPKGESSEIAIKRLEREIAILRQEREILKKAVAIFSNPNK
jgi:transposase